MLVKIQFNIKQTAPAFSSIEMAVYKVLLLLCVAYSKEFLKPLLAAASRN
jgi:hypothetical protein